jgi:hypothetical protein
MNLNRALCDAVPFYLMPERISKPPRPQTVERTQRFAYLTPRFSFFFLGASTNDQRVISSFNANPLVFAGLGIFVSPSHNGTICCRSCRNINKLREFEMPDRTESSAAHPALHGKANRDRNTRGAKDTSAKTDVFVNEFLRDPVGMRARIAEIAARYKKKDGDALEVSTVRSWYSNWCSGTLEEVCEAVCTDDWSHLKTAYYPAVVDEHKPRLLRALALLAVMTDRE